jgi:hypothetical protein
MLAVTQRARDRFWLAETLIEQNRRPVADAELVRVLTFYRAGGRDRYILAERPITASASQT